VLRFHKARVRGSELPSREFRPEVVTEFFPAECNHLWIYARQLRPQLPEPAAKDQDRLLATELKIFKASPSIALSKESGAEIPHCVFRFVSLSVFTSVVDVVSSNIAFRGVSPRHVIS